MLKLIMRLLRGFYLKKSGLEKISPNDWVKRDQIDYIEKSKLLTIKLEPRVKIFSIADTNSMDGLLDIGHNVIATDCFSCQQLAPGDVIIYNAYGRLMVHRIIEVGKRKGLDWYCRCRGDNNVDPDPWFIDSRMVKWVVIGIIY